MRLNEANVNIDNGKLSIETDLLGGNSPFCVVYCGGKAKITTLPDHGETKVITHQGKVKRVKFDEGEEF
ncbi:XtrA/YqaO family protein [Halobacillus naozhouensis]|uniref:XtrA/YqaO family protein n=1 Tax=Halobacillus naozhouensis TaxID=554880 RepID=A0ABY8J5P9_9BACI|nr:XtrA/YqaO family protein [Halobacillus naozhouensis]WFT76221.1 XtrA/YqaO family protein [Halobacillus naozhouensis]